jgi:hypothetical protein
VVKTATPNRKVFLEKCVGSLRILKNGRENEFSTKGT